VKQLRIKIPFKEGLHARPSLILANICNKINSDIVFSKGDKEVNPKSILGIMTLGAVYGDEVVLKVTGEDEEKAMEMIKQYFNECY